MPQQEGQLRHCKTNSNAAAGRAVAT